MSSMIVAVRRDCSSLTAAIVNEYGRIFSVSRLKGTCGIAKNGRLDGRSPMSPTVRSLMPKKIVKPVRTMMLTNAEGTRFVRSGNR
jgi:hypothetical protein